MKSQMYLTQLEMMIPAIIIAGILFIVLSPGMILNVPPKDGKFFMTRKTSWQSVLVHALVFMVLFLLIGALYYTYY